jgi:hypothetical protein
MSWDLNASLCSLEEQISRLIILHFYDLLTHAPFFVFSPYGMVDVMIISMHDLDWATECPDICLSIIACVCENAAG